MRSREVGMAPPIAVTLPTIFFFFLVAWTLSFVAFRAHADHVLYAGEALTAGQNLSNGQYQLAMQKDCNLVLYDDGKPTWKANITHNARNCYLGLRHNGELIVRGHLHYPLWSSKTRSKKKGRYVLVLENNGMLNVYGRRLWSTPNKKSWAVPQPPPVSTEYVLHTGDKLVPGGKLVYRDYELVLDKCNMVINDTRRGELLWQTRTESDGNCYLQLQPDGVLTLNNATTSIWSSDRNGVMGMYIAVVRFDSLVFVYGPSVWSSTKSESSDDNSSYSVFEPVGGRRGLINIEIHRLC